MSGLVITTFIGLLISGMAHAHGAKGELCKFLPENDLYIPEAEEGMKANAAGMTEQEFNRVIDSVERIYKPIAQQMGGSLLFRRLWSDGTVNARAMQQGRTWIVEMYGGLARHNMITPDGLAVVACHEVGHHLGGAPKYTDQGAAGAWASVEGQSDYFATLKCLRKVFAADGRGVSETDPTAQRDCDHAHGAGTADSIICQRIVMAGVSSANMSGALAGRLPSLNSRDTSRVSRTYEAHPQAQCRLDTYKQGALCPVSHSVNVDQRDPNVGVCLNGSSEDYGARPLCWYKPANVSPAPTPAPTPPPGPQPTPMPTPAPGLVVAPTPLLNGKPDLRSNNPQAPVWISYDVSSFPNAYGVFFEISRPNVPLARNGVNQDRSAWRVFSVVGARGQFSLMPQAVLPGWGVYQIRMIPLDRSGRIPQGQFSDPAVLTLQPNLAPVPGFN